MNPERLKLGGILFIVGGVAFLVSGVLGERTVFFVLGCAFLAIGAGFLAQARRESPHNRIPTLVAQPGTRTVRHHGWWVSFGSGVGQGGA